MTNPEPEHSESKNLEPFNKLMVFVTNSDALPNTTNFSSDGIGRKEVPLGPNVGSGYPHALAGSVEPKKFHYRLSDGNVVSGGVEVARISTIVPQEDEPLRLVHTYYVVVDDGRVIRYRWEMDYLLPNPIVADNSRELTIDEIDALASELNAAMGAYVN